MKMSDDRRILLDSGKDAYGESYVDPFMYCKNPRELYHIIDLIIKGKRNPYQAHKLPFVYDNEHPGRITFEKFKIRLNEEKAKPSGTSDWLERFPQLTNTTEDNLREIYNELRAEAVEIGIAFPESASKIGNVEYLEFPRIYSKGRKLLYKDARQCYINIRKQNPELPPLPSKKNNILACLQELQDCCIEYGKQKIPNSFMSPVELAEYYKITNKDALRKRLERFRQKHTMDSNLFIESQNRGANKPKYLYNPKLIAHILDDLKEKENQVSNRCPTGKK
jgi:hypothetical protein